jgi:FkbM family methyltransferase
MLRIVLTTFVLILSASSASKLRGLVDPKTVEVKNHCHVESGARYLSQFNEDRIVYEHFFAKKPKCDGVVLEIGGFNGKTFSNSWFFEYGLHWKALLVEAFPVNFEKMVMNRPNAINVWGALCKGAKSVTFQIGTATATGGIAEEMTDAHKKQWTNSSTGTVDVPCLLLSDILAKNKINHVDVFFLDVEGAELKVLETINWSKVRIDMIVVEKDETNFKTNEMIKKMLTNLGYIIPFNMLDEIYKRRPGQIVMPSEIYVRSKVWRQHERKTRRSKSSLAAKEK